MSVATAPRIEVGKALKDAGLTALITFALFLPLIGFKTVQNMRNELELETRFPLLLTFVAVITAAKLFGSLVVDPWRERRALRGTSATFAAGQNRFSHLVPPVAPRF